MREPGEEELLVGPSAFSKVDTEPSTERMLGSPRTSWVPGVIVDVGGEVLVPFTTGVVPRLAELRDKETRLEPAMGPKPLGGAFDVLYRAGESAGSSDPWTLLLLLPDGLP